VQAVPNHAGEAARLVDAADTASLLRAARNEPDLPEFAQLPVLMWFGRLVRARADYDKGPRVRAAMRGLFASTPAHARAAAAEFAAALDDLCSSGPRFSAIAALACAAELARTRPLVADAIHSSPPKWTISLPRDLPALEEFWTIGNEKPSPSAALVTERSSLTKREREILVLLSQGLTNKEIAQRLVLSVRTVDAHVEHILAKLNVSSRTRAVAAAAREGLLAN
jgi:DNA-binding NarL/FixJ family response regulator